MRVLLIRTYFKHHSKASGYKRLGDFIENSVVIGYNELAFNQRLNWLLKRYRFIYEFIGFRMSLMRSFDIVHLMYGEEYFRFSHLLFNSAIVVTFHQPPEILRQELQKGSAMGRVMHLTHRLTKKRFSKVSAAIVLTEPQKEVLKEYISEHKIHVIPLGVDIKGASHKMPLQRKQIVLTVGNWQRDWNSYLEVAKYFENNYPDVKFYLVNRKLPQALTTKINSTANIHLFQDITDNELSQLYIESSVQFLPFIGATGNNSLNEGLSFGLPVVSNILPSPLKNTSFSKEYVGFEDAIELILLFLTINDRLEWLSLSNQAYDYANSIGWESIAKRTLEIYRDIL